jgi:hypothetical protein
VAACCTLLAARGAPAQKANKSPAELLTPKPEAVVSASEDLEGRLGAGGWPVVLVRRLGDGSSWVVQPAVTDVADGTFSARALFGGRDTPKGSAFGLVIAVAKSKAAAAAFKEGTQLDELPADLPHSKETLVYRDARGRRPATEPRTVQFAGRTWRVKAGRRLGPGPNDFADAKDSVWVDADGSLHLAITKTDGKWSCAEVVADRSLGFGEYRWVVAGGLPTLDRWTVLGLFTYETTTREIDFELSRWGVPAKANAQFVVQPYTIKGNLSRFETGTAKVLTVSLIWGKSLVRCRCWVGTDTAQQPLADWSYKGRFIPSPGKERARANFWLYESRPPASGQRQEVLIRSFGFQPVTELPSK